jgi:hypothetical protein
VAANDDIVPNLYQVIDPETNGCHGDPIRLLGKIGRNSDPGL